MPLLLFIAFVVVPVIEIFVIIQVGALIGVLPTVAILLAVSVFGAWLVRREGRHAWRSLNAAMSRGELPGRELADAALVLIGGTLLLTPGFVTDALGFVFVLPPVRPLVRRMLLAWARRRTRVLATHGRHPGAADPGRAPDGQPFVRGEVVDDDREPPRNE